MTTRPTVLASIVLALALLGDSLLYAVLPLHAPAFGISLAWVGVLLSANRVIRLFAYPFLARIAAEGLRRFTIAAAALGSVSTLVFAGASGPWTLLAARLAWGAAFGSLSLSALAYATSAPEGAGRRVGLSLSLRELGPLLSLTGGLAAVAAFGVRPAFALVGMVSLLGVLVARRLPDPKIEASPDASPFQWPGRHECLGAVAGFIMDGIFPATIGLLLARSSGVSAALIAVGALLGLKRIAVVALVPISGRVADRFGARTVTTSGFAIGAAGALLVACNSVFPGAVLLSCSAAVTTTSIPASVAAQCKGADKGDGATGDGTRRRRRGRTARGPGVARCRRSGCPLRSHRSGARLIRVCEYSCAFAPANTAVRN